MEAQKWYHNSHAGRSFSHSNVKKRKGIEIQQGIDDLPSSRYFPALLDADCERERSLLPLPYFSFLLSNQRESIN
jgi:hypothetical protein